MSERFPTMDELLARVPGGDALAADGHHALDKIGVPPNGNLLARIEWLSDHAESVSIDQAAIAASYRYEDEDDA